MEIKVKKAVGSAAETSSTISLGLSAGVKLPERVKSRIKNDVGEYLVEQITLSAGKSKSPVEGESWKATLSKSYAAKKKAEGLGTKANLEEEGDLLDALTFDETDDGVKVGWFGDQSAKADGHANISGDSPLPQRRLIPDVGQEFKSDIQENIEKIVVDALADETTLDESDFEDVGTKGELYSVLQDYFPGFSNGDIRDLIARSPSLAASLDDMGVFNLL